MSDDTTPRLNLPLLQGGQAQKHITLNEGLMRLESLVQAQVLSRTTTAQPATPADGDSYILPASATGAAWASLSHGMFVRAESGTWESVAFPAGAIVHIADEGRFVVLVGGAWTAFEDALKVFNNLSELGVGTTADSYNVLAVKGAAALLSAQYAASGGSGNMSLTLNKEGDGNSAQILWQKDYATRAILGLLGNNDVTLKVSPDGSRFITAFSVDHVSGLVSAALGLLFAAQSVDPSSPADGTVWYNSADARLRVRQNGHNLDVAAQSAPGLAPASGRYLLNGGSSSSAVLTGVADRMDIVPWVPVYDGSVDQLGLNVTTGVGSATVKIVVYDSDALGRPNNRITETGNIAVSSGGAVTATVSLTFNRGRQYWLGVRHSSTAAISAYAVSSAAPLDASTITLNPNTILRRSLSYTTTAPVSWNYVATEAVSDTPPAIFLRMA